MKKLLLTLLGLAVVLGLIIGIKGAQIASLLGFVGEMEKAGMPPTPVASFVAEAAKWEDSLRFTGTLRAVQGVMLTVEVGGTINQIAFENGAKVQVDELLIQLDTRQETAELATEEATLRLAALNLDRTKGLLEKRIISQSEFDTARANYDAAAARVEALKAIIAKKTIRAPFAGQAGIRMVNLGQTVRPGDELMPLQSSDPIYAEFAVPQTRLGRIKLGQLLRVTTTAEDQPSEGIITAINPIVDEASRTARVQGTLHNPDGKLRPGEFVQVDVVMPEQRDVITIPMSAVIAAAFGDSVFIIEEKDGKTVARQQFVQLGPQRGDFVSVIKGLKAGDRVVSAGAFKLTNGAGVVVDDKMQPEPALDPSLKNS
jgi:membrane fusion protein (multidrug efflux system)